MIAMLEQIKPETAELLAIEAEANGLSVDEYLRNLLPHSNGTAKVEKENEEKEELTPQEKARRWVEFVDKYSVRVDHFVDDSRESVYTREDELL
ncbi:MAG: hypothetical protein ABI977_31010 [Acidobacteriota bacterium]